MSSILSTSVRAGKNHLSSLFFRLATVQEARSNTPLSLISSSTLDQAIKSQNDPVLHKKRMLDNVRGLQVDHHQRMELIKVSTKTLFAESAT